MNTPHESIRWFSERGVVRMSDFKTSEYASLLGAAFFEPAEAEDVLRQAIAGAKRNGRHVGVCGRYLVEQDIESISLNPDSMVATARRLVDVEREPGIAPRGP